MTIVYEVRNKANHNLAGIVITTVGLSGAAHAFLETKYPKGMTYQIAFWSDRKQRAEISIAGSEFEVRPIARDFEGVIV